MDNGNNSTLARRKRLASLTTHLRTYEKPKPNGYDRYATSYIVGDIPWKPILQEESSSYAADLPPFSPKFEIHRFALQAKERKLRGKSIRKQDILASPEEIAQHFIKASSAEITTTDRNQHLAYLFLRAMQYSEVNKALALDERYPMPDADAIRSTYSREHQAAIATTRRQRCDSIKAPSLLNDGQLVKLPKVSSSTSEDIRRMATGKEREQFLQLRKAIREALGSPLVSREMKVTEEPWQFKAKSERLHGEQLPNKRKTYWKRNVYPPKTREERIAELRAKALPLTSEYLETDNLPGMWKPELMIEVFKTSYMESKEKEKEDLLQAEDDWAKIFQTNKKCMEWLKSIPNAL